LSLITYDELRREVERDLLDRILSQSPDFFERLVVELLKAMGYAGDEFLAEAVGKSGDGGIDGVIHQDSLGLEAVYIQAKRYDPSNSVGRPALQAFIGSLSGMSATKGVFITTSSFSANVEPYLQSVPQRVITIDGDRLVELMVQHGVGVRVEQTYTVYRVDEDFFADE
jgi:restriction system protein